MKTSLLHRLQYLLFCLAERVLVMLPWKFVLGLGRVLGRAFRMLDARHRRMVRRNLRASKLGLSESEIRELSRACFEHYGSALLSSFHLLHMKPETLKRWVPVEGLEHWEAARSQGKGVIILTGHYGNWEATALSVGVRGYPLAAIGRPLDNPLLDQKLRLLRSRLGNTLIAKGGALRDSLKALRGGASVGFLLDQDALTAGLFVKFLGQWASTHASAALLAMKYGIPVVPLFSEPRRDGTIAVRVLPALELPRTGSQDQDVWMATQIMTQCLEEQIRRDPQYWFWMHNRFKTRPGEGHPLPAPLPPSEWLEAVHLLQTRA